MIKKTSINKSVLLLSALIVLFFVQALSYIFLKQYEYLNYGLTGLFILILASLAYENKKSLKTRSAAFGIQSIISIILVFCIIALINFVAYRYPKEFDLTTGKLHTLSDQTEKLVKGLNQPVEAIFFASTPPQEAHTALLNKYKNLNTLFDFRMADPNKEMFLAKKLGINRYDTLVLQFAGKTSTIEDPNEEKLTNALIKITQSGEQLFCVVTGHGEPSLESSERDGYQTIKKALENQAYKIEEITIAQAKEIPTRCNVLGILGPKTAFFEAEAKAIDQYLTQGGRALIALDIHLDGKHSGQELFPILKKWTVEPISAFLIDTISQQLGLDVSIVPILSFAKDHAITKTMTGTQALFPVSFPFSFSKSPPPNLKITALGETTAQSWGENDFASLKKQKIGKDANDLQGPLPVALAIEDTSPGGNTTNEKSEDGSKPSSKKTKIVVFGTSQFMNNQFSRYGANLDFFMNAASWLLDDENLISIRGKDPQVGRVELSTSTGQFIFFLVVIALPLIVALAGFIVRWKRRRL